MSEQVIAQFFGLGALIISAVIYSRKNRSSLLLFKALQDILWGIHYLLLSCWSAAAASAICISRSLIFCNSDKKWAKNKLWVFVYIGFYMISAVVTWQNIYSILPTIASCTSTVAFSLNRTEHTKIVQIAASLITLTYNILQSHSVTVYLGVALTVTTASISLYKHYTQKRKANM